MTLDEVQAGRAILIDSTIFIYHFTGVSAECRRLLERCERGEIRGSSSAVVLAEVAHRLMMVEAVSRKLVPGGNVVKKLRSRPDLVRQLHTYQQQVERIPLMGIKIEPLDLRIVLSSQDIRRRYGLLVNDSLVAATAVVTGIGAVATADADFRQLEGIACYAPSDVDLKI